jgi:hypothetical protein
MVSRMNRGERTILNGFLTGWREMKCFACDGKGVECCPYCDREGECASCGGRGETARACFVAGRLPAKILAKLRDLHARGIPISSDPAFFHFGGGLAVRNLCRERLSDAGIAAMPVRTHAPVSVPQPWQLQFSFIEAEL